MFYYSDITTKHKYFIQLFNSFCYWKYKTSRNCVEPSHKYHRKLVYLMCIKVYCSLTNSTRNTFWFYLCSLSYSIVGEISTILNTKC